MEKQKEYVTKKEVEEGLEMFWEGKPRELPSVLSGFTPAPDVLIQKLGYMSALVWGRVWRYCQMADGVCRASLDKIAGEIGVSTRTIIRHADRLCLGEYLLDTTPDLKNKPHIYADTGKIRIRISVEATMTESHSRMALGHGTMTESHSEGDSESLEESIKKESKKELKEKSALSQKDIDQVNKKVDAFIGFSKQGKDVWRGREYFRDNQWLYADWYHGVTGQIAAKSVYRSWQKAFSAWQDAGLTIESLETAKVARLKWKEFIADPNELTKDAAAVQAMPYSNRQVPALPPEELEALRAQAEKDFA